MRINESRPVEELTGNNYGIVRQRLAECHCMRSVLDLAREVRPKRMREFPVQLRRGWAKCVIETVAQYRSTFIGVMSGNLGCKCELGAFD